MSKKKISLDIDLELYKEIAIWAAKNGQLKIGPAIVALAIRSLRSESNV